MRRPAGWLAFAALALLSAAAPATPAAPRCVRAAEFRVERGELRDGKGCGVLIGETDGSAAGFAYGDFAWREPVQVPFAVSLRWRRLSSESGASLELLVPGAIVLIADDRWGVYVDEAQFSVDGWHELRGFRMQRESQVRVERDARGLVLLVDGVKIGEQALGTQSTGGTVAVAFKGPSRVRARMTFRDFRVESLAQRQ